MVSLVLFSMVAIGSAEESFPSQDVDGDVASDPVRMSEGTEFGELDDIGWAVEGTAK